MNSPNTRNTPRIWLARERELAELEAALDDLPGGRGSFFLVTGEPGIGKTRLADELSRLARARGVVPHWGRAWEAGGAPSYWPFIQVLRSVCRGFDAADFARLSAGQRAELAELLPEHRRRIGDFEPESGRATRDRFQLFDAVSALFEVAVGKAPHAIVLDDLHATDASSLLLLHFLVRGSRSRPLLLVGTYREAEARLTADIGALLVKLAREATVLPLRRLDRGEVGAFVAQTTGAETTPEQVEALHRQTEGNPLFLRELLRLGAAAAGRAEGIREVVRARLSLLTSQVRAALEPAAVLGREFDRESLAAVAGLAERDLLGLLAPAVDASIVEPLTDVDANASALRGAPARWRFTHVLLREGLYEEITPARRIALHERAASELRRRGEASSLSEIAHHLMNAIPNVSVADAADAARLAAERAMEVLAFEDACALLERPAKLLEGTPDEEERLFEVRLALGLARIRGAGVEAGKEECRRAAELARQLGDGERFARAVLASAYEFTPGVRNTRLIDLLEEAIALLPPGDGALRARCMAQLAAERQPEPDTDGPIELARAAVAMARRAGDKDTLRFTLTPAGLAMMVYADPAERTALNQEGLLLALGAGDKRIALRAHLLLTNDCWEQGDLKGAEAHVSAYEALSREFRHGSFHWITALARGQAALWQGRFEVAERCYREAAELIQKDETRGSSLAALPIGFACAAERYDDLSRIESRIRSVFGSLPHELGGCIGEMLIAHLHGRAGDRVRAAAQLATLRAHPLFGEIKEAAWLALLADPCHLLGDVALAERLYPVLLPRAQRFFNLGHLGPCCEPPYSRQLGLLAETLGRFDRAIEHFLDAQARTALAGMSAFLARLRYELAGALLARGAGDDRAQAVGLLNDARILAEELGQTGLIPLISARTDMARSGHDRGRAQETGRPAADFVLRREGEYWTIAHGTELLRLRDSRGLQVLAQLVASPGQEFHVLQLVGPGGETRDCGDAGPLLDSESIQSYRRRLLELREELEEAEGFVDAGRAERAQQEIDFLTHELARAVGLGGRERRSGLAAERARTTVQKRLRNAIQRIEEGIPDLGKHLGLAIRSGTFCGYFPDGAPRTRNR